VENHGFETAFPLTGMPLTIFVRVARRWKKMFIRRLCPY
jgi:hypothetical protein